MVAWYVLSNVSYIWCECQCRVSARVPASTVGEGRQHWRIADDRTRNVRRDERVYPVNSDVHSLFHSCISVWLTHKAGDQTRLADTLLAEEDKLELLERGRRSGVLSPGGGRRDWGGHRESEEVEGAEEWKGKSRKRRL
jgi:hypothetical protein